LEEASAALSGFSNVEQLSAHPLDLREFASIEALIESVEGQYGRIDILLNNAAVGTATVARFADDEQTQDSTMLAINADGTLKMCQAFLACGRG
jgi:NADP-dependent 3-hydroxy acid dehydrogenase YdfG